MANEDCCFRLIIVCVIIVAFATVVNGRFNVYRTYDIEDNCDEHHVYRLSSTKMLSTLKLKAHKEINTFRQTHCHFYISPPSGYEVVIHLASFELGFDFNDCRDSYLQIYRDDSRIEKLCGIKPNGTSIYFKNDAHLYYHGTFLRRKGFTLVATAYTRGCYYASQVFKCANGNCIWDGLVKDGVNNCGDNSDEVKIQPTRPFVWDKSDYDGKSVSKILPYIILGAIAVIGIVIVFIIRERFCVNQSQRSVNGANVQLRAGNRERRRRPQLSINDATTSGSDANTISNISQYTPPPSYSLVMKDDAKNLPFAPPPPTYSSATSLNFSDIVPVRTSLSPIPEAEATKPGTDNLTTASGPAASAPCGWI